MVDKIVELENDNKYLILDETLLDEKKYYYSVRLNDKEELTNNYLFFEEVNDNGEVKLLIVNDEDIKNLLLTDFTVNYLNMAYDEV